MFITLVACSSDDNDNPASRHEDIVLTTGDTYMITDGANWQSEEPLIASITGNVITAERVGVTRVYNENASFDVTVNPRYYLYDDPCMQWGASTAAVNSFMRENGYTTMRQTDDMIVYDGKGAAVFYGYLFEDGMLASVGVLVDALAYNSVLSEFLMERYVTLYIDADADLEEALVGMSAIDKSMWVVMSLCMFDGRLYVLVLYAPSSSSENHNSFKPQTTVPQRMLEGMGAVPVKVSETIKEFIQQFNR